MLKRCIACLACALASSHAAVAGIAPNPTGLWYDPAESGWGLTVAQQGEKLFAVLFVYDQAHQPAWYFASDLEVAQDFRPLQTAQGALYRTTGPWFGGLFSPLNVTRRVAGSVTFTLIDLNDAILTYSVDGVAVTKSIQRETWTTENYTGSYLGGYSVTYSNCNPSSMNGAVDFGGALSVTQSGSSVTMFVATDTGGACSFNGSYTQAGKYGQVEGTYTCGDGTSGTFVASEMTPTINGFTSYVSGQNQYCQWSGTFGGITRARAP